MRAGKVVDGNPIIRHKFTADPTAIVHDGTIYLYTGHDEAPPGVHEYVMNDWLCFSSRDLAVWTEHPVPLRATDFRWSSGRAANLDPTLLIVEGVAHLWWGNGVCYYAELTDDLRRLASSITTLDLPRFEEGAHVHAANGWYYLCYGYGVPERVAYAMSRSIKGPWEFVGILNEIPGNSETNRPCIFEFKGESYFAYHNGALPGGGSHRRSVCIDRLYYNSDGTMRRVMMTSEGISP